MNLHNLISTHRGRIIFVLLLVISVGAWYVIRFLNREGAADSSGKNRTVEAPPFSQNRPKPDLQPTSRNERPPHSSNVVETIRAAVAARDGFTLHAVIQDFQKGEFHEVWKLLSELPEGGPTMEIKDKAMNRAALLEDPEMLIAVVGESAGPGMVRDRFIQTIFTSSNSSVTELASLANLLEEKSEQKAAYEGLGRNISNSLDLAKIDFDAITTLTPGVIGAITSGLGNYHVGRMSSRDHASFRATISESLSVARRLADQGRMGETFLSDVAVELSRSFPFNVWEVLEKSAPDVFADERVQKAIIQSMIRTEPLKALDHAVKTGVADYGDLTQAVIKSLEMDRTKVENWYNDSSSVLDANAASAYANGFARYSSALGDFETAWKWVGTIADKDLRKKAESQVWPAERDAVRKQSETDPHGTVQALVSRESKHADYWLEEAMMIWIAKDSENAEVWYKKNWNSLPPAKSQYIAAAYAKEALEVGDIAVARQWANLIQDPKTKDRIATSIDKAQSTQGQ
jgi:hypothetical protein